MTNEPPDPFEVVANALGAPKTSVDIESAMGTHPYWDSLNQVRVVASLEQTYGITIADDEIMKYSNMRNILVLYAGLSSDPQSDQ